MNQKKPFIWVTLFFTFCLTQVSLNAQAPIILDSKMKPVISNDMRIEELKVRWKKSALENCPGVPCVTAAIPGAPTSVVATAGNTSASVAFTAPTNNGGSVITVYTVTSNPGNIPASGTTSPINVTGLMNGTAYTFTVVATNAVGNSVASAASTAVTSAACPITTTVTDVDGNVYNTVTIGTQVWTRENLKVTKYNDGTTVIPDETSNASWHLLFYGARAEYVAAGVTGYGSTYGYLYTWYAAAGIITAGGTSTKNICPVGWHVPNDADWTTLIRFIDINEITILNGTQSLIAGGKIKEKGTTHWGVESPGTDNSTCFTALPGGKRRASSFGNGYSNLPWYAYFWSSTSDPVDNTKALYRELCDSCDDVSRYSGVKGYGYSVRCVKD
jgi:uncharacterized protein (TIGR02145 family)